MRAHRFNTTVGRLGLIALMLSLASVASAVSAASADGASPLGSALNTAEQSVSAEQRMSPRQVLSPAQIHQALSKIVATFNTHAQGLVLQEPARVGRFMAFVSSSLAKHWDTRDMAIRLLGAQAFGALSGLEQRQIYARLETTFHRYALEVVDEYRQSPMVLMSELVAADETGLWRVKIRAKPRILPAMTGELFIKVGNAGWAIVDAGYAGFTYVSIKDGSYQREFARHGVVGLLAWLDEKNIEFFSNYCRQELVSVMPVAVSDVCRASM
ncbi:MAG: hypothetical protein ACI96P_002364 [Candidatus Azotimanducaceae bacterium]|jgi:hypothetical protein